MALACECIGAALHDVRVSHGRSLRELAAAAQVGSSYLWEVERGRKEVSSELVHAICRALDIPASTILIEAGTKAAAAFPREE